MAGFLDMIKNLVGQKQEQPNAMQKLSKISNNEPNYYNKLIDYEGMETSPYEDNKGIPTIGIGHKIMPGENFSNYKEKDFEKLFIEQDLPKYINRTRNLIRDFDKMPVSVKEEMVASVFRGGLSGSPKTLELINNGQYKEASKEFLNNDEYKDAKQWEIENNDRHGVARRMENLSKELNSLNRRRR